MTPTKSVAMNLGLARELLEGVKTALGERLDAAEARREELDRQLTAIEDDDQADRFNLVVERAAEIAESLSSRLDQVESLIDTLDGEIDAFEDDAKTRKRERVKHGQERQFRLGAPRPPKVTKFIIQKSTRSFNEPYRGNSCERGGVKPGLTYNTREEAQGDCDKLNAVNSKGFDVRELN